MECAKRLDDPAFALPCALVPTDPELSPEAAAVRSKLLEGLTTVEAFAAGAGKCKRTVDQWIAQGMPTVRVGKTPYIPIAEARAWLLKPSTRNTAPRTAGRPRKAA